MPVPVKPPWPIARSLIVWPRLLEYPVFRSQPQVRTPRGTGRETNIDSTVSGYTDQSVPAGLLLFPTTKEEPATMSILAPAPGVDYESLMFEDGDGSVTRASLLSRQDLSREVPVYEQVGLEPQRELFVCAQHDALTSNDELLDALIEYLLATDAERADQAVAEAPAT